MDVQHIPVLLEEAIGYLAPQRGGLFVDCTVGLGGHAERLLRTAPGAALLGIDRDPEALALAAERLRVFGDRARLVEANFMALGELATRLGIARAAGVLVDLGVSSLQLDRAARGFSFRAEGPLDMRMGAGGPTAGEVVNEYSEADLESIFRQYGEEWEARRIARAVVAARGVRPLATTTELAAVVRRAKRTSRRAAERQHDPATQVFQALRIEVNQELAGLAAMIEQAVDLLETDGRLVVISYHSLEDRIAKNTLRGLARGEVDRITGRPRSESQVIEVLTKKPVRPSTAELAANPRSRSARLRAARRLERA